MPRILLIDDDPELCRMISAAFRDSDLDILTAYDGESGCQLALSTLPDLIVCDIRMEGMNGFDILTRLRGESETSTTPFIFITGANEDSTMRRGMDLGADDFLRKPFEIDELRSAIDARLKKHKLVKKAAETQLEELRSQISLMLPHELNTPLNGIIGYADMIVTDADDMSVEEFLDTGKSIRSSARRLQGLIERFLMFAQIELLHANPGEQAALRKNRTSDIAAMIKHRALEIARARNRSDDLMMKLVEATIGTSQELLLWMVGEIIDNAFKFSQPGTTVAIRSECNGADLAIIISDLGLGMRPDQVASIGAYRQFERKLHEQQGSGLGLIIAKRLAELHGGSLSIESKYGRGTSVTLELPLAS